MRIKSYQHLFLAAVSLCGLLVAGLWLVTAGKSWPGVLIERSILRNEAVSMDNFQAFWSTSAELIDTILPGSHLHLPGLVGYTLARSTNLPAHNHRAEILHQAEQRTRQALLRDPAAPHAWARLAWFLDIRQGSPIELLSALRMSMYLAPADTALVFWRIKTAARYQAFWNADFEHLLARQVAIGWRIAPHRLVQVAKTTQLHDWIRAVLSRNVADIDTFDAKFKKTGPGLPSKN